jgi:tRNA (guanine26-N2/guanine27-N2)-dimethyltransferase
VAPGGVLFLTSSDGRAATGHDRSAAVRRLGAAARAHPASWELALRLQLGVVARAAWSLGRDVEPLLSFSEGRTFRTAVRLPVPPLPVGSSSWAWWPIAPPAVISRRRACCGSVPGPHASAAAAPFPSAGPCGSVLCNTCNPAGHGGAGVDSPASLSKPAKKLLDRLISDPGHPARCWPTGLIGRCLGQDTPSLGGLTQALRRAGFFAVASGIMPSQLRSDAPGH